MVNEIISAGDSVLVETINLMACKLELKYEKERFRQI